MKLICLQLLATRQFSFLGEKIGNNPQWFIIVPCLVAMILTSGVLKISFDRDINRIFTATNGRASREMKLVEDLFEKNKSLITVSRTKLVTDFAVIQIVAKYEGSIFRKNIFRDIAALDRIINTFSIIWEGRSFNYSMVCAKVYGQCQRNNVLELASFIREDGFQKRAMKYPVDFNNATFTLKEYVFYLGGIETDESGYIIDGKAIRMIYIFDVQNSSKSSAFTHWINSLNKHLNSLTFSNIHFTFYNYEKVKSEFEEMTWTLKIDIPIVICAIALFSFFSCMTNNIVRCKPLVGISACVSAVLATASGFGTCLNLGVTCTDYHLILAFSILAIEVDDAYVLIAAWRTTNPRDKVHVRMRQTYSGTGVSVTITSITNIISFFIGIFTPFPLIRYICIYAAATVLFSYIYLLTFFGACLALDGYREQKTKHPLALTCKKGINRSNVSEDDEADIIMTMFRGYIGSMLNYPIAKIIIVIFFITNLVVGLWGLKFLDCGNEFSDAFKDDSQLNTAIKWNFQYFSSYSYPIHVIIDQPLNYADPKVQKSIEDLLGQLEAHPHLADSSVRISWLKYYKMFANSPVAQFSLRGYDLSNKSDFIDGLNIFLNIQRAKEFKEDIVFNDNFTDIIASRFLIPTRNVYGPSIELQIRDYVYSVIDHSPLPVRIFCMNFHLLEQAELIKGTVLMTAIVASCLILFMFFLFVPNVTVSLCIFSVVICMFCETVGYMSLWGVKLDICSLVTLIVCIGFSINYPTHISFSYISAKNKCAEDRVKVAMFEVGMPILQGSVSTVLGIIVLAFQSYYSIRSVFKVIFIITIQTAFHSLFFILVLISAFGRCDKSLSAKNELSTSSVNQNMLRENNYLNEDEDEE